jgi:hypothetical protein
MAFASWRGAGEEKGGLLYKTLGEEKGVAKA